MPVDYSKWDALELSDDSDIEVHPNVDKRSFIRAKQNQIHQQRAQRKHQIETLQYERLINDGLASRISALLDALKSHADDARTGNPAEVAFGALMASYSGDPKDDIPPPRPQGIHADSEPLPTYTKMMATLLDQVNKALDEKKPDDRYSAMVDEIGEHLAKVQGLQKELLGKLAELEKEEKSKITSESYHTGFDSSHVSKEATAVDTATSSSSKPSSSSSVELLNPAFKEALDKGQTTGTIPPTNKTSSSSTKDDGDDEDKEVEASPAARKFGAIKMSDYRASAEFLASHPQILSEAETDGLLVLAFDAALDARDDDARQLVHQALLLQYSRALGRDGVALFFKRITTKGHQAQGVFFKDVQDTYGRLVNRAREIRADRAKSAAEGNSTEGVEQIQLQAVEPGTVINIRVPPVIETDAVIEGLEEIEDLEEREKARKELIEQAQQARAVFDGFPEEMRKALETGKLDEVNKVLGEMPLDEAEAMVELFSEANILGVEKDVIDPNTDEGKQRLEEIRESAKQDKEQQQQQAERTEDPE